MRKIYEKNELLFALVWIVIYVIGASVSDNISKTIGVPHLITVFFSAAILVVLLVFMFRNGLAEKYGLCGFKGSPKKFLFFIPLAAICTINFWNGAAVEPSLGECIVTALALGISGVVEELTMRGLLFKYMCKSNIRTAVVISSLTFGLGHIVNLLNGAPLFSTVCQIIYACAVGFCFTMVFMFGKSIIPCAAAHFIVNASSAFGAAAADTQIFDMIGTIFLTVVSAGYGIWLAMKHKKLAAA